MNWSYRGWLLIETCSTSNSCGSSAHVLMWSGLSTASVLLIARLRKAQAIGWLLGEAGDVYQVPPPRQASASGTSEAHLKVTGVDLLSQPFQLCARCQFCDTTLQLHELSRTATVQPAHGPESANQNARVPLVQEAATKLRYLPAPLTVQNPFLQMNASKLRTSPFDQWFIWCQTCNHGGHSRCLREWFDKHPTCPVSNCNCRCHSLDSATAVCPSVKRCEPVPQTTGDTMVS